jgi:AbrB family looped-hinge helix DNA binding protein
MTTVNISDKGQITVPAAMRRRLGLRAHSRVTLELREDELVLRPVKTISEVAGIFREQARGKRASWEKVRRQVTEAVAREVAGE